MKKRELRFESLVIHSAQDPKGWQGATNVPIYQTASHFFESAEELSLAFSGKKDGYIYQRLHNPTDKVLEDKISILEGGARAIATSSGMSAITNTIFALVRSGDEIVSGRSLFLSTYLFFTKVLSKYNVKVHFVDPGKLEEFSEAINERTRLIYVETIGNPQLDVPDISNLAKLAHKNGIPLVVDNTLATPYLFQPIKKGADIVIHSTTKFLNGHGSAVGGIIIDAGKFDYSQKRFPDFKDFVARKANLAFSDKVWREIYINIGCCPSPFQSFLTILGLNTLALRMERHLENAKQLAEFLDKHPKVRWVNYPGLPGNPFKKIAKKQFEGKGYGALLTFGLKNEKQCFDFIKNLRLAYHLANLGDCKTLVIHPYSSQYINFPVEERVRLGILPEMIRVSLGIEAIEDIIYDFDCALKKVK